MADRIRVAINAQLKPGKGAGGIESVLIGLVRALGQLRDAEDEYVLITSFRQPHWLDPYLGPNQRVVVKESPDRQKKPSGLGLKRWFGPLRPLAGKLRRAIVPEPKASVWPKIQVSDGFYEQFGVDVIHFPYQTFTVCALPIIYNPHDLQHRHLPQFFSPAELARRETVYAAACRWSKTVVVGSQWIKQDVISSYGIPSERVQVIPWASPTQAHVQPDPAQLKQVEVRYGLTVPFAYYPAMTWPHKNHIRLLQALALLRDRDGLRVQLVCSGHQTDYWPQIQAQIESLAIQDQVKFVGLVPHEEVRALYRLAQFVIVPSLFESASGPVIEAWSEDTAVGCSNATSLPQQVGDAGIVFDPYSVEAIADAAKRLATDDELRNELRKRGQRRLLNFSWERTAKAYRAVYRRAAGRPLNKEDRTLLAWDWMKDSQPPTESNVEQ